MNTLVSTEELAQHPEWRVFDCRHDLANPALGEQQYLENHIPGALFAHLDRDLSAPKNGGNGRHPLPETRTFISWMGKQGLKPADQIVCYDGGPGVMAARLWWMLRWAGHEQVSVLDGGLAKWQREGRPVTTDVPQFESAAYPGKARASMHASPCAGREETQARRAARCARAGALPGASRSPSIRWPGAFRVRENRFSNDNLSADGVFKKPESLRAEFRSSAGRPESGGRHQLLRLRSRRLPQRAGDGKSPAWRVRGSTSVPGASGPRIRCGDLQKRVERRRASSVPGPLPGRTTAGILRRDFAARQIRAPRSRAAGGQAATPWRSRAQSTCSRTKPDGWSFLLFNASIISLEEKAFPSPTARLRSQRS